MNSLKTILIGLTLISVAFSCNINHSEYKVGFLLPTYTVKRYEKDRDYFVSKVKELGGEVEVANAENDDKLQIEQAEAMISKGIKLLVVIAVNQNTAAAIVRAAHDNNIKVIAYERLINNCELDYYIGFDHFEAGKQMAEYATKHKPNGKYVLIGGDKSDNNAILINNGIRSVIMNDGISPANIILYNVFVEDWNADEAFMTLDNYLNLATDVPEIILPSNDGMAGGVIRALEKHELLGKVVVGGLDAELSACKRIINGTQSFTIYKPFKKEAEKAAEVAMLCAKGEEVSTFNSTVNNKRSDIPAMLLSPILVDSTNLKSTIVADGFYTIAEVNNKN